MQESVFYDNSEVGSRESAEARPLVDQALAVAKRAGWEPFSTRSNHKTQDDGTFLQSRANAHEIDEEFGLIDAISRRARSRTLLVTAAAGAMTAATVLMGWGLRIGVSEVEVGRRARMAMVDSRGSAGYRVKSFYDSDGPESATLGVKERILIREQGLDAGFDEATKNRLDRVKTWVDTARTFVQKRAELSKILAQLRTHKGAEKADSEGANGTGSDDDVGQIVAMSERRSLVARAEELRKELNLNSLAGSSGVGAASLVKRGEEQRGDGRERLEEEKAQEVPGREAKRVGTDSVSSSGSTGAFVRGGGVLSEEEGEGEGEGAALERGRRMIDLVGLAGVHGRLLIERLERSRVERMVEFASAGY